MTHEISSARSGEYEEPAQDTYVALIDGPEGKILSVVQDRIVPPTHAYGELFNLFDGVTNALGEWRGELAEYYRAEPLFSAVILTPPWSMRAQTGGEEAVFVPVAGNAVAHFTVLTTPEGRVVSTDAGYSKRETKTAAMQLPPGTQIRSLMELRANPWMDGLPDDPLSTGFAYDAGEYRRAIQAYAEHNPAHS